MEFKDVVTQRRSAESFDTSKDVLDNVLKEIINTAALCPSSFNFQPWNLIVVRDKQEKEALKELTWNQDQISDAPVVLVFLSDLDSWKETHPFFEKNFRAMVDAGMTTEDRHSWVTRAVRDLYGKNFSRNLSFSCKNTGIFAATVMYAAKNIGLDTHAIDAFNASGIKDLFNIPDNFWIPLVMAVGYLKEGAVIRPHKYRKQYDEIVVRFN